MLPKNLAGLSVLFLGDRNQQMVRRDKLVLYFLCLLLRGGEDLAESRAEILLTALNTWKARNGRLNIVCYDGYIDGEFAQNRPNNSLRLLEHSGQQMLWFNLLVLISFGQLDGRLHGFLSPQCKSI